MPIDIIIIAVVATFLLWKLRKVITSDEQTFLKKNTQSGSLQVIPEDQIKVATVGKADEKKAKQLELAVISSVEKTLLKTELHQAYDTIFAANPAMKISFIKQDVSQIYEEVMHSVEDASFVITSFMVEQQLMDKIRNQSAVMEHKVFLQKVESVEIVELMHAGKMMNIVASVKSQQIVYKEDEAGNIVSGSKTALIDVTETLFVTRAVNGSGMWLLINIK